MKYTSGKYVSKGISLIVCKKNVCVFSCSVMSFFAITRTIAHQAPLFMKFSWQEHWNGLPFPSPGDLPNPKTEPVSPALQVDSLPLKHGGSPCKKNSNG